MLEKLITVFVLVLQVVTVVELDELDVRLRAAASTSAETLILKFCRDVRVLCLFCDLHSVHLSMSVQSCANSQTD